MRCWHWGRSRVNKSLCDGEQAARRGTRPSRAGIQPRSVPGIKRSQNTVQPRAGRARRRNVGDKWERVPPPLVTPNNQTICVGRVVRNVKTQPINKGGSGFVPLQRAAGRAPIPGRDAKQTQPQREAGRRRVLLSAWPFRKQSLD